MSNNIAKSVVDYLIDNVINKDRLDLAGYLSLHDALPIYPQGRVCLHRRPVRLRQVDPPVHPRPARYPDGRHLHSQRPPRDRKSTRLNSSHVEISYATFHSEKETAH